MTNRETIELATLLEPHERFKADKEVSADLVLFNSAEIISQVMVTYTGNEAVIIHKDTTVGQYEVVETEII